jgi:hypothetical protein
MAIAGAGLRQAKGKSLSIRNDTYRFASSQPSQTEQSLRCCFWGCENRGHFRRLGSCTRVSVSQFFGLSAQNRRVLAVSLCSQFSKFRFGLKILLKPTPSEALPQTDEACGSVAPREAFVPARREMTQSRARIESECGSHSDPRPPPDSVAGLRGFEPPDGVLSI